MSEQTEQYGSFSAYLDARGRGEAVTEAAVREFIAGKAGRDDGFRKALLADPRATVEAEVGIEMPGDIKLVVHEETNEELHLVLPSPVELTPAQLESVSGGWPPAAPGSTTNDDALYDNDGGNDYD